MLRSRLRLLWLVIATPLVAALALPGLPHGCEGEIGAVASLDAPHVGPGQHHGADHPAPKGDHPCRCLGHACCAGRLFLASRAEVGVRSATPVPVTYQARHVPTRPTPRRYLLPVALAPPGLA